jgi:MYXO-CTERM domain-containing protein
MSKLMTLSLLAFGAFVLTGCNNSSIEASAYLPLGLGGLAALASRLRR